VIVLLAAVFYLWQHPLGQYLALQPTGPAEPAAPAPVFATAAVVSYAVDARRAGAASLRAAVRRGLIAAALVILNFVLLAAHKWSLPVGVATVVAAVVADIALRPRARATTSPRPAARVSARDE